MIKRIFIFIYFFFSITSITLAQHDVDFVLPSQACVGESLIIQNTSDLGETRWNFCSTLDGTYNSASYGSITPSLSGLSIVEENGVWIGFAVIRDNGLFRIEYSGNPATSGYTVTSLGNPGGLFNGPDGIHVVKSEGKWFGLVSNQNNNEIIRLTWNNLYQAPISETLNLSGSGMLSAPAQIEIEIDGDDHVAIIANSSTNRLTLVNFGSSLQNNPGVSDMLQSPVLTGTINMYGVTAKKVCNEWIIYTSVTDKMYRVVVGSQLFQPILAPQIEEITLDIPVQIGAYVRLKSIVEGGDMYVYFTSFTRNIVAAFVWRSGATQAEFKDLTSLSVPGQLYSLETYTYNNTYGLIIGAFNSGALNNITITSLCSVAQPINSAFNPQGIAFNAAGSYNVTLSVQFPDGVVCGMRKEIVITPQMAPDISFSQSNICVGHEVSFTSQNSSQDITDFLWDFGDGIGSASSAVAGYTYSTPGSYTVSLGVESSNGCRNFEQKIIKIYDPPSASFSLPTGLICTNNEFTFVNSTVDNFDGNLSFQWLLDDVPVSTDEDLLYTFTTGGDKELTLQASIPGCTSESVQVLSGVGEGPTVDFTIDGNCLNETIQLTNNSLGDIAGFNWAFGDGQTSNDTNPGINYAAIGNYDIELETMGANGCISTKSVAHQIFSVPQPNFNTDLPPFSCNGTPTQFNDLTPPPSDSNIETWLWDFADQNASSSVRHPQHTYALSGDYNVTLTVTSDQGCVASLNKSVTIAQAPQPSIENTAACVETAVILKDGSSVAASAWQWQIGNNFYFTESPSHVFANPGSYQINFTLTTTNGCVGTANKVVNVPSPLVVDFESTLKCANTATQFSAIVDNNSDPVVAYTWSFGNEEQNGTTVSHLYEQAGTKEIRLTALATSGCTYSITRAINIVPEPVANFSFTPSSGPPPLAITFTNLSSNANAFHWEFNDAQNSTSENLSPSFTFDEVGDYPVDLTVKNAEGCEHTVSKLISIAFPFINATLDNFRVIENSDGSFLLLTSIQNNGNVLIQNPRIEIQLDNITTLEEVVNTSIVAGDSFSYTFSTMVRPNNNLDYACIRLLLPNNEAANSTEACLTFNSNTALVSPYPNPANDYVMVEWISSKEEMVSLSVNDNLGNVMTTKTINALEGLNTIQLQTIDWQAGIYFFKLKSASGEQNFRTIISR